MNKALVLLTILNIFLAVSLANAESPKIISYQGVLTDANGIPVADDAYTIKFSIYDAAEAAAPIWESTKSINVTEGTFSTILGTTTDLTIPFDKAYYLGITVGTDSELTPRIPVTAAGYALRASRAAIAEAAAVADSAAKAAIADVATIAENVKYAGSYMAGEFEQVAEGCVDDAHVGQFVMVDVKYGTRINSELFTCARIDTAIGGGQNAKVIGWNKVTSDSVYHAIVSNSSKKADTASVAVTATNAEHSEKTNRVVNVGNFMPTMFEQEAGCATAADLGKLVQVDVQYGKRTNSMLYVCAARDTALGGGNFDEEVYKWIKVDSDTATVARSIVPTASISVKSVSAPNTATDTLKILPPDYNAAGYEYLNYNEGCTSNADVGKIIYAEDFQPQVGPHGGFFGCIFDRAGAGFKWRRLDNM